MPTLIVTGATGRLGRDVIDAAARRNVPVVAISRDPARAVDALAGVTVRGWEFLPQVINRNSVVVHLAARNNDVDGELASFLAANVGVTEQLFQAASLAGARRFIFASSGRADAPRSRDYYGLSKRAAEDSLARCAALETVVVRLPALHAGAFAGRLAWLNGLPSALRPSGLISALRPELARSRAAELLVDLALSPTLPSGPVRWSDDKDANSWYRAGKRAMDLAFAGVVAGGFFWLLFGTWLAVKLSSPGPGLFIQDRVGRRGQVFRCYKFRTMRVDTPHAASHLVSRGAVTRVGHILRRSKLDELPQVVNLLRGDMSLVGPRPCLPQQTALVEARRVRGVLALQPGITGWAQVNDIDMSDIERLVEHDDEYRHRRSLLFDLGILLATVRGRGRADRTAA